MAKLSQCARRDQLRALIEQAIEDDMYPDDTAESVEDITLAIDPTLTEVYAGVNGGSPFEDGDETFDDWHVIHVDSYDEALDVADQFFDPRLG